MKPLQKLQIAFNSNSFIEFHTQILRFPLRVHPSNHLRVGAPQVLIHLGAAWQFSLLLQPLEDIQIATNNRQREDRVEHLSLEL